MIYELSLSSARLGSETPARSRQTYLVLPYAAEKLYLAAILLSCLGARHVGSSVSAGSRERRQALEG